MKKLIVSLITVAFLFSVVSCVGSGNSVTDDEGFHNNSDLESNVGGTFIIKTESEAQLSLVPSDNDDSRMELIESRYRDILARFNCKISASVVANGSIASNMITASAVSGTYADLIELSAGQIYDLYKGGYLTSIQDVEAIDIDDEKWGFEEQKNVMTFGDGKIYGFRNTYWAAPLQDISGVLFYNEDIILKNMLTSPYDYYESGEWNWTAFEYICKGVTQNINDLQGVYGFMIPSAEYPEFIHAAIYSNGGQRLKKDSGGKYVGGYNDSNTIEALEWVADLVNKEKVCYMPGNLSSGSDVDIMSFTDRYTVFLVSNSYTGFSGVATYPLSVLETGFRWIEFPRGSGFEGETTVYYTENDSFLALAKSFDSEKKGVVLDALFEPLDGENSEDWKKFMNDNYFFYEEDSEFYYYALEHAVSDFSILTQNVNKSIDDVFESVITGRKTAKEAVETLEPVITGLIG